MNVALFGLFVCLFGFRRPFGAVLLFLNWGRDSTWSIHELDLLRKYIHKGKQSFKDHFCHIEILAQLRARSVAAHSEKSVLFRPHAEI